MAYFNLGETKARLEKVREILRARQLDAALVCYDELNVANGWYLTGWCPQFEKGCVLVPLDGTIAKVETGFGLGMAPPGARERTGGCRSARGNSAPRGTAGEGLSAAVAASRQGAPSARQRGDEPHGAVTPAAGQRVSAEDLLDQACLPRAGIFDMRRGSAWP